MMAERPEALGPFSVICQYETAFTGGDVLHRMEAQDRHVGDASYGPVAIPAAQGVRRILDDNQAHPSGGLHDGIEFGRMTSEIHR